MVKNGNSINFLIICDCYISNFALQVAVKMADPHMFQPMDGLTNTNIPILSWYPHMTWSVAEQSFQKNQLFSQQKFKLTFLGVEEEERLVQRLCVLIGRRRAGLLVWDGLGDDDGEADEDESGDDAPQGPPQDLALDDDASEVHVLVLLLGLRRA